MLSNRKGTSQAIIFFILASACFLIGVYYLLESSQTEITLLDEVTPLSIAEPAAALRLSVSESGIVALSDSILKKAGLRVSSFSDNGMSITHNGRQIPLLVLQEGEKNKHLYFYAEHQTEDPPSIYLLEPNQGKSMGLRDGRSTGEETTIGTQHRRWETKELLLPNTTGTDNWFSDQIVPEYPLILELLDVKPERAQPATLTLSLWGITDIVHQVELSINEKLLDTLSWQGATGGTFTVTIPPYTLNPTKNELTLTLSDTSQKQTTIYLDWVELHYSSELKLSPNKQLSFYSSAKNFTLSGNGTNAQTFIFDVSNSAEPIFLSNLKEKSELLHVSGNSFGLNSHYIAIKTSQAIVPKIDSIFRVKILTAGAASLFRRTATF